MNQQLLTEEIQQFILNNELQDIRTIGLKKSPFVGVDSSELAQQLKGKQVAKYKFPHLYKTPFIYYPPSVNLEQASSEATANYKSSLVKGVSMIDLTAGFGMDSFAFTKSFTEVIHVEKDEHLSEIVAYNAQQLKLNVCCYTGIFSDYFHENSTKKFDLIYLDPARRDQKGRKFMLQDLEPNVLEWMDIFFEKSNQVMIKLSPLLDLTSTLAQLPNITSIHLIAVKNELKDFLVLVQKDTFHGEVQITATNLQSDQKDFSFNWGDEENAVALHAGYETYLYDPNVSLLKAGVFRLLAERYKLKKLHPNTHLYTSNNLITDFPGRIFEVIEEITHPKKQILKSKTNVLVKNFPHPIDVLKKKYQLKDGGDQTVIFTQSIEGIHILKTKKI